MTPSKTDRNTARPDKEYDLVILGAGLGGLLTAANLAQRQTGLKICVIERLGFIGGRFTSIPYNGYQISSGAIHLLPHGNAGPVGKMLKRLIKQKISTLKLSYFASRDGGKLHLERAIQSYITSALKDKLKVLSATMKYLKDGQPEEYSAEKYLVEGNVSADFIAHLEKFTNFSMSVHLDEISAFHLAHTVRNSLIHWKPGLLVGGCGSVCAKLSEVISAGGIDMFTGYSGQRIHTSDRMVTGVSIAPTKVQHLRETEEKTVEIKTNHIISDIGPKATRELLAKNAISSKKTGVWQDLNNMQEACGFKFHVSVKKPPINDFGVVFPLYTSRICGWSVVSNGDGTFAPAGKHLLIAHAMMKSGSRNLKSDIDSGIEDLELILGPQFETEDILSIGTFHDNWPVNRAIQGNDVGAKTPVDGLYLVGDGCKPLGYMMAEGVAESVNVLFKNTNIAKLKRKK
jgi:phytoene dehydrogenase-like protein